MKNDVASPSFEPHNAKYHSGTVSPDGSLNVSLHGLEIGKAPPAVVEADNVSSIAATTVRKVPFHDRFALPPPELVAGLLS